MLYALHVCIPREHEARAAANKGVKAPATVAQAGLQGLGQAQKYGVGLHGENQLDLRQASNQVGKCQSAVVAVLPVFEPDIVLQHTHPRGGEKAHFRGELPRLFAAVVKTFCLLRVEEQHRITHGHAVFGAAKAQHIYACFPGHICWGAAQSGASVGKACAVHMQA